MKKYISLFLAVSSAVTLFAAPTMNEGWKLLNSGKFADAEKVFRAIAASDDPAQNYDGTVGIMYSLRRQQKNDILPKEVDEWIAKHPQATVNQKAHLYLFKGNALRDLGKIEESLAAYKQGIDTKSTNHNSSDCAKEYMMTAANNNKVDLGVAMYEQTCNDPIAKRNVGYLLNAGHLCWKAKKGEEGLKVLDAAEKLIKNEWLKESLFRTRGYIYRECLNDQEKAVKAFEQALNVQGINNTQKAVLWNNIGMAYERDEEYEKAVEAYKKVGTFNAKGWFIKSAENSAARLQKKIDAGE